MIIKSVLLLASAIPTFGHTIVQRPTSSLGDCPGYIASNVQDNGFRVTADLALAGTACNVYGEDLPDLKLEVEYQTGLFLAPSISSTTQPKSNTRAESRLHVKIFDAAEEVTWTDSPFSFAITRRVTNETLFDTSAASLVFETQYLRLRTTLPDSPHLYGLGESTDPFHLNTSNYTRTVSLGELWTVCRMLMRTALEPRRLRHTTGDKSLRFSSDLL
jgi:alpha-glucosidase